ncbi:putative beta-lysine N-acetyltransferase [Metabacillus fastidiosus]|uniref:putative beta-lysine N-acetyltransferase n=1 Tax=Metabacillus fastidiosus TaxID=1458 RepID=UPI002E1CB774|nr:putative beta-lysine N-acetyltransferase [Metabacillus fastidiosus]MED4532076.1 putative beta-lysine N-acetyltransferase [Metabacillus fastidiosus]
MLGVGWIRKKTVEERMVTNTTLAALTILDFYNERLKIEEYRGNLRELLKTCLEIASENKFTKLIIKAKSADQLLLLENGFTLEAVIKNYFYTEHAYIYCKYLNEERRTTSKWIDEDRLIENVRALENSPLKDILASFHIRKAVIDDCFSLSNLYKEIFHIYPVPITDPSYIEKTMKDGTIYYCIEHEDKIISVASAEINDKHCNAEITDCATLPPYRKHQFMQHLITALEEELRKRHIFSAYSIARAPSFGMNKVFYQLYYTYTGRLINNCYIYKELENMNVWCKDLSRNKTL